MWCLIVSIPDLGPFSCLCYKGTVIYLLLVIILVEKNDHLYT